MSERPTIETPTILRARKFIDFLKKTENLHEISRTYQNLLYQYAVKATPEEPITYLIPTCPEYSETNGKTDYKSMKNGVPTMAKQTIDGTAEFIQGLAQSEIPFQIKILIADQEVGDENILNTMNETPITFLSNIMSSKQALEEYLNYHPSLSGIPINITTFMSEFCGKQDISALEKNYIEQIESNLELKNSDSDKLNRMIAYTVGIESERIAMLHSRLLAVGQEISLEECARNKVIYNLAQYLSIGDAACKKYKFPVIGVTDPRLPINLRNSPELKLSDSDNKTQPTVPLISCKK